MSTVPVDVVKIDTSQSIKSVSDLRKYIKQLKDQMVGLEEGSDEFLELANKIGEANHQMVAINEAVKGFSADFGDVLGNISTTAAGVVGGINAISSAVKIFGGESELAQEAMLKLQQSMAIVQGLSAIDAGIKSFKKLIPVIKLATTAMRAFAMSNPFTAIIAGATMLIGLIAGISSALDKSAEKAMKNAEAFAKAQEKQFKSLDKAKERQVYELRYAEALGKSTEELYKMEKAQKASNVETARSIMLKAQAALQDETDAEAKKKLLEEYKKAKSVYEAELKDYQNLQNNKRIADAQAATNRKRQRDADSKAAREERKRIAEEKRKEREDQELDSLKFEEELFEEQLARGIAQMQQLGNSELEIAEVVNKRRLEFIEKQYKKYDDLAKEYQEKSKNATDAAITKEYAERANGVIEIMNGLETEKMQLQVEKAQLAEERISATIEKAYNDRVNAQNAADLERAKQHLEITKGMAIEEATVMGELGKMFWNTERQDEYLEKIKSIQDTITELQSKGSVIDAELEKLEKLHENKLISEDEYISQKLQLDMQQVENAQAIANAEIEIERTKNKQKADEAKKLVKSYQEVSSAIEDVLGGIAANMDENSAEYKAIMIAQTIISMLSGSVKAWTAAMDLGMPAGAIVGAIQSAAIIANGVATINKMKQTTKDSTSTGSISSAASSAAMHPTQNVYINNDAVPMENVADTRVYVLESDITSTQRSSRVQVSEATF